MVSVGSFTLHLGKKNDVPPKKPASKERGKDEEGEREEKQAGINNTGDEHDDADANAAGGRALKAEDAGETAACERGLKFL